MVLRTPRQIQGKISIFALYTLLFFIHETCAIFEMKPFKPAKSQPWFDHIGSPNPSITHSAEPEILHDRRGKPEFPFREMPANIVRDIVLDRTLEFDFDLRFDKFTNCSFREKFPIILLESPNAEMILFVNSMYEFGIKHYNKALSGDFGVQYTVRQC